MITYRLSLLALLPLLVAPVWAEDNLSKDISKGLEIATAATPFVRFFSGDPVKRETGRRMLDAVAIDTAVTYGLKWMIHSDRPRGGDDGFPSYHTSAAFAVAMSLAEREPETAWVAFPLAALQGWARVDMDEHTWAQVLGGAAIGAFIGHMCGSGQWHLLGHANAPEEQIEAPGLLLATSSGEDFGLPSMIGRDLTWETTLWSTRF